MNSAQEAIERLEMFARMGDEAGTMASTQRAKEALERILSVTAWSVLRVEED